MKHHSIALWKTGPMNSIVAVSCSKTSSLKVLHNVRSSCDLPLDKGILEHFFHQLTFNIAWKPGNKNDLFSFSNKKRFVSIAVKKCWINTIAVLQNTFIRSSQVTNHRSMRMSPKQNSGMTVPLEHRRTVNSEWHTTICLKSSKKRTRIIVHNGNASSGTSA